MAKERQREKQKKPPQDSLFLLHGSREGGRGKEQRPLLTIGTYLLGIFPTLPLPASAPDASLCASSSAGAGILLPTSAAERKSRTAWLHLTSATRSRILNRYFPLPVSSSTSAHRILCWAFQLGRFWKTCSRVWVLGGPWALPVHLAMGWFPFHFGYWPVREWPVFSW